MTILRDRHGFIFELGGESLRVVYVISNACYYMIV